MIKEEEKWVPGVCQPLLSVAQVCTSAKAQFLPGGPRIVAAKLESCSKFIQFQFSLFSVKNSCPRQRNDNEIDYKRDKQNAKATKATLQKKHAMQVQLQT